MSRTADTRRLLTSLGFVPTLRKVGDGCVLTLPAGPGSLESAHSFRPVYAGQAGVVYNAADSPAERLIAAPGYAARLCVQALACVLCRRVPVAHELIAYQDERGRPVPRIEDVIEIPDDGLLLSREGDLVRVIRSAVADGFTRHHERAAAARGVLDGYRVCRELFHEG